VQRNEGKKRKGERIEMGRKSPSLPSIPGKCPHIRERRGPLLS